jgi:hypothetical protein
MTVNSLKNSAKMLCSAKQLPETLALNSKDPLPRLVSPCLDLPTSSPSKGLQVNLPVECLLVSDLVHLPAVCLLVVCLLVECPLALDLLVLLLTEALEIYLATH